MRTEPRGIGAAWPLLVAGFAIQFVVIGGGIDTVSVFLNALAKANGWPKGILSAGIGVGVVAAGLATPGVGVLVDRFGARLPIALGAGLLAAGFVVLFAMSEPWHFVAANVLLGPGFAATAMLPITIAVTVRVPHRTAFALGVVSVGASMGALLLAPSLQMLIDAYGWRATYATLGVAVVATPLVALLAMPRGRLQPRTKADAEAHEPPPIDLRRDLRRPGVAPLAALLVLPGLVNFGFQVHVVPYLASVGHGASVAAAALGAAVGVSAIGKLAGGAVGDRIGALRALRLALSLQAAALVLLLFTGRLAVLWLFVALHGIAVGTEIAVTPVLALRILGESRFATLYGLLQLASTVAIGLAPVIPGLFFDATGSYTGAVVFWIAAMALAVVVAFSMRSPRRTAAEPVPASP
jgi:predicted MFS family arabinose efflux permease